MDLASLTLEEKCRLLGGASNWRSHPVDRVGFPALKLSDGPNGVRGDGIGTRRTPGLVVPAGIALGATWDPDLVGEVADVLGREAIRKGAHVLLAPTVNLHRTPIGGRVFECYSEDPELTAALAVAFVRAVQAHDVAVTVKHLVVNDTEVDRMSVDVAVDDRPLRELYLRPFEAAVVEGGAWGVMSAYNKLRGEHCADNGWLLTDVLRDEWGFDGFVVSDWFGSHHTVGSALAGLDLAMPGPRTIYGEPLRRAVEAGEVPEARVDELVADLARLVERTRAVERSSERPEETVDDPAERALARRAVHAGLVLVRNDGTLPLEPSRADGEPARIAVVGPNAADTRIMGGGSASLEPLPHTSVLDALAARTDVVHEPGVRIDRLPPPPDERRLRTPDGEPGVLVEYRNGHDPDGDVVTSDVARTTMVRFFGSTPEEVDASRFHVTVRGTYVPEVSGPHEVSAVITGAGAVEVGGVTVLSDPDHSLPRGPLFFGMACEGQSSTIDLEAGVPVELHVTCSGVIGFAAIRIGVRPPDPDDLLERAVAAAADADAAVVVVGTNDEWETEGEDRTTLALPGAQDELVARVAAVNPRTVVVVNAGAPVTMPWIDDVAAVVLAFFGGNEMGEGVADVLLGDADPGGRSPVTYPARLEDVPAWPHYAPVDGVQTYGEGLLVGYRGVDAAGSLPLVRFGHGLSYGEVELGAPSASTTAVDRDALAAGVVVQVRVPVTGVGRRPATVVPQVYVAAPDAPVERAPKALAGWTKAVVEPGATRTLVIDVGWSALRRWDPGAGDWTVDLGHHELVVATSSDPADELARLPLEVTGTSSH